MGIFVWWVAMILDVLTILFVAFRMVFSPPHEFSIFLFAVALVMFPLINMVALIWAKHQSTSPSNATASTQE